MEREKIISEIQSRLGQTCVSERTIGDVVDFASPADGTEPDDAYYDKVIKLLGSFNGNINNYTASQTKLRDTEIKSLKEELKGLKGVKPKDGIDNNDGLKAIIDRLEKIEKTNSELNSELASYKNSQTTKELINSVRKTLKEKCDNEEVLNIALQTFGDLDVSKSADVIAGDVETKYNALIKKLYGNGYEPKGGNGGTKPMTSAQAKAAQDEFKQQLIRSGQLPKPAI